MIELTSPSLEHLPPRELHSTNNAFNAQIHETHERNVLC
jgi:hypothetical protein